MASTSERELERLRAQAELSEIVISSSRDGILAFDREVRYTLWNPAMEEIAGLTAAEVLGRCAFEVFPFLLEIGEDALFRAALAGEHVVSRDRHFRIPATGREGWFEARYSPLRDAQGQVVGGLSVVRDITERKRAEDALRAAQLQVVQSGKLAAMGQLGAGIAHELNQPLAGIKMLLSLIQREPSRRVGEHAQELAMALEQVDRMARIVDNVRAFARKSDYAPRVTPALGPLDAALMLVGEQLRLAGVEVVRQVPSELPPLLGDGVRLQQVFLNLLGNAQHALEDLRGAGPRRIELSVAREQEQLVFRVRDTGPGVTPAIRGQIFDPFFTTKEAGRGTGLGLSLADGIVREHGGEIAYEEPAGGGACFVVRLPVAQGPLEAPRPAAEVPARAGSGHVLVVDDEEVVRRVVGRCLEHLGYTCTMLDGGERVAAELARGEFDLAVVDLRLPDQDGVELCARIRQSHPELGLIAMSGFVSEAARRRLERIGIRVLLAKPFGVDALQEALGRARAPAASPPF